MEKISGILPSSPRITGADLKNSGVARSGTPSFGRPTNESLSQPSGQMTRASTADRAIAELNELQNIRSVQNNDSRVEIVNRIANDFFGKAQASPVKTPASPSVSPPVISPLTSPVSEMPELTEEELLSLPELGAYLDVEV